MKLSNKTYDVLKYIVQVGLPALTVFIGTVGGEWGLPRVESIVITLVALNTLMGALLVLNQVQFAKTHEVVRKDYTP